MEDDIKTDRRLVYLAEDRDRWWAVGSTVMNLWFPRNAGNVFDC